MSEISFEPSLGMRDFYPEDMAWRNRVFDAFRAAGEADADLVIVNSCTVRQKAERAVEKQSAYSARSPSVTVSFSLSAVTVPGFTSSVISAVSIVILKFF